ncbi:hypothetical protein [Pelagibacterium montanilacus]|uniref:hypothetical protein n=1 Tax=Pelagibacterium montanilacus TaxID=2185280 RepID=UPI000F8E6E00|nr:hypothetical protein [Pelagibacterium montanilacus]
MTVGETIKEGASGWSAILSRRPDWEHRFEMDARGLNFGFVAYALCAAFAILCLFARFGMPVPMVTLTLVAGYCLPVLGLIFSTSLAKRIMGFPGPVVHFYVPGLLMLALFAALGGITLLLGIQLWGAVVTLTAFMTFRLARAAGPMDFLPALGFALANFVAGLPLALYMMGGRFAVFA